MLSPSAEQQQQQQQEQQDKSTLVLRISKPGSHLKPFPYGNTAWFFGTFVFNGRPSLKPPRILHWLTFSVAIKHWREKNSYQVTALRDL
jgi:hypothetical protein